MRRTLLIPSVCALLVACDEAGPTAPSRSDMLNTAWQLHSITRPGDVTVTVPDPSRFTLLFRDDGRVSLRADCNSCSGSFQLDGSQLRARALACTRAFCGTDSLDTEFLRVFDDVAEVGMLEGRLFVSRDGTRLTFGR
jgi:heat shock protein HslJ